MLTSSPVEGIITTGFGIICFFFLPHTPAEAKFLTDEERVVAMARMMQDAHGAMEVGDVNEEKFNWHWVKMALQAPQTWLSSLIWFFILIPLYVSLPWAAKKGFSRRPSPWERRPVVIWRADLG